MEQEVQLRVEQQQQEQEEEEEDDGGSTINLQYRAAHQAVRERWRDTDDTMCRHSMSFHLHHTLRSEFFASYLYLVEKIPLGEEVQGSEVTSSPGPPCSLSVGGGGGHVRNESGRWRESSRTNEASNEMMEGRPD